MIEVSVMSGVWEQYHTTALPSMLEQEMELLLHAYKARHQCERGPSVLQSNLGDNPVRMRCACGAVRLRGYRAAVVTTAAQLSLETHTRQ